MTDEIRVLLAEDHPLTLKGLRDTIREQIGMKVIAETADAETTLEMIQKLEPEVAILDIYMPKDRRSLETRPVAEVAQVRLDLVPGLEERVEARRGVGRERDPRDLGPQVTEDQRGPRALEAGVAGQKDPPPAPEGGIEAGG